MSVCLFARYLLRHLWTDLYQTWQEGWGRARKTPCGTCFHRNQFVAMATKKMVFYGQIWTVVGYDIACDVTVHDITSSMTSYMTSPWQWHHGNHLLWYLDT